MFTKFLSVSIKSKTLFTILILILVAIDLTAIWVVAWNIAPLVIKWSPLWYGIIVVLLSTAGHATYLCDKLEDQLRVKK